MNAEYIKIQAYLLDFYTSFYMSLTGITIVELILVFLFSFVIPQLGISVFVVLHQCSKEDDEDDLQDDA